MIFNAAEKIASVPGGPRPGVSSQVQLHRSILSELGYNLRSDSVILDFGCGEGERVQEYRRAGFNTFGVDIKLKAQTDCLRLIDSAETYRIPFEDSTFDFVFSESVFEHVKNHGDALAEICRVLKPGGVSLHLFPPKWIPIEPHVFVPLGGVFQAYSWLLLWAAFGVRNSFQENLRSREVAAHNYRYLKNNTHYLSKKKICEYVLAHFPKVVSAEKQLIKHSYGRARYLKPFIRFFPFIVPLYREFHLRTIFFTK
jgi:SAM-dependent methyltransferase